MSLHARKTFLQVSHEVMAIFTNSALLRFLLGRDVRLHEDALILEKYVVIVFNSSNSNHTNFEYLSILG